MPRLCGNLQCIGGIDAHHFFNLRFDVIWFGGRQVDLVEHGNDLVIIVDGQVDIGQGLRLNALGGVDHQKRALASGQRPANLIGEVHMARRIHQV